jgi:predicted  nucleic acid-binding Zn-ribbon protein
LLKYNDDLFKNEEDLKEITKDKGDTTAKSKTINDIKNSQKVKNQEIVDLKKQLLDAEKEFKSKMDEIKRKMQDSSKKITSI